TIVGDVRQAATAAMLRAVQLGFVSDILTTHLEGEAREVGRVAAAIARDTQPGCCRILGGETTVTLRGQGIGGRNQEVALAAAIALAGKPRTVLASVATDGDDGPTGSAGAVVTGETAVVARQNQLDLAAYLDNNDSHTCFTHFDSQHFGDHPVPTLIKTGQTGTNVNDLILILTYNQ
ncbi:MAG: glycerate kinase, partial [Anaerolineales bacterium]|nr:glycerate kinase [Anaerolineales bacterium]